MSRVLVVVSYFLDRSEYPRGGRGRSGGDVYWRNIAVNAATLDHVDGDAEFVVYAGDTPDGPAAQLLEAAGADLRHAAFAHEPPLDFYGRYAGSLYVLDVMAALADELADDDVVMFVDPDIVWAAAPAPLVEEIRRGGVVAYDLQVPDDLSMCLLTRTQQAQVTGEVLGTDPPSPPQVHFGGEFYGMLGATVREVQPRLETWWDATWARYEQGLDHFTVEEHLMNALLWERGEQVGRANDHLQRIRTLPAPFSTRERVHDDLVAWHLPFEKERGFEALLRHLAAGRPMPPAGPGYRRWLRRRMGIEPTPRRWVTDRAQQLKWRLERRRPNAATPYGL